MHLLPPLIRDLAVILGVGGVVSALFQRVKQPAVLGYLIAGIAVGSLARTGEIIQDLPNVQTWADIGIIFLMFSLGLEFSFRKLLRVGAVATLTALVEVSAMLGLGFGAGRLLGWGLVPSLYLAGMVAIASTTIILKSLEELGLKSRRFAQLIFGVLVVEDLIAILLLVVLGNLAQTGALPGAAMFGFLWRLLLVVGAWFIVGFLAIPRLMRSAGQKSADETILLLSVGLCLCLAVLAAHFQYSVALGAFIMGSILAETTESRRIEELVRPIRDLFGAIFFVSVGMLLDPMMMIENWRLILVVSVIVLAGKTLFVTLASLLAGQTLRSSVQIGMGMAQIGEFSFIIASLGAASITGDRRLPAVAISVCLITSFTTPYFIRHSQAVAARAEDRLPVRAREFLDRYAAWNQQRAANRRHQAAFTRALSRWFVNGVIVSILFVGMSELNPGHLHPLVQWALAALLSSPFLLMMFRADTGGMSRIFFRLLTLLWLGLLSLEYVSLSWTLLTVMAFGGALAFFFFRQLESAYGWLESKLLSPFQSNQPKTARPATKFRHLAPWDAHLTRIKVHPNSEVSGRKLSEALLRTRFGLNVVAIQRGMKSMVAPNPAEIIFPRDELLVLGTDEQLDKAKRILEDPPGLAEAGGPPVSYDLKNVEISEHSPLIGQSLRSLSLRERFGSVVVGIERGEDRILNPDPLQPLAEGDVLWLVSSGDRFDSLRAQCDPS